MRSVSILLAVAVAAMAVACSADLQPLDPAKEGEVQTWVRDLSNEEKVSIIRVTFFDTDDVELFFRELARKENAWSQSVSLPLGTYTASAAALDADGDTLFVSGRTPEFSVGEEEAAEVHIFLYQDNLNESMDAPSFLSVTLDKAPAVGEVVTVTAKGEGGRGGLTLTGEDEHEGDFFVGNEDGASEGGATLGWIPAAAGQQNLTLHFDDEKQSRATVVLPVTVAGAEAECEDGLSPCDGECVDFMTDPEYCGSCEISCVLEHDEICLGGECVTDPNFANWLIPPDHRSEYDTTVAGVAFDEITGLHWERNADSSTMSFNDAEEHCRNSPLSGEGWRVPTFIELYSLIESTFPAPSPRIDNLVFPGTEASTYWTSTPGGTSRWRVNFSTGSFTSAGANARVRCVRGSHRITRERYVPLTASSVLDVATGLVWRTEAGNGGVTTTFSNAESACATVFEGHTWRLPAIKELLSIVVPANEPRIDPNVFTGTVKGNFWSSSHSSGAATFAVNFESGSLVGAITSSGIRPSSAAYRCVRGPIAVPPP